MITYLLTVRYNVILQKVFMMPITKKLDFNQTVFCFKVSSVVIVISEGIGKGKFSPSRKSRLPKSVS